MEALVGGTSDYYENKLQMHKPELFVNGKLIDETQDIKNIRSAVYFSL